MFSSRAFIFALTMFVAAQSKVYSQCELPNITKQEFCLGQQAEVIIDDPDANVRYHWYQNLGSSFFDLEYGETGDGKLFLSLKFEWLNMILSLRKYR